MKKGIVKFSMIFLLMLVLLNERLLCFAASAGNPEDVTPRTLVVRLTYTDKSKSTPVKNAKIQVSQVAELVMADGSYQYRLTDNYSSSGLDINSMKSASDSNKAAKKLNDIKKKNNLSYKSGVTDSKGKASFSISRPGIYLVTQNGWKTSDVRYTEFSPYLVKLPMPDSDEQEKITGWEDEVVTEPKIGIKKKTTKQTETPTPTPKPNPNPNPTPNPSGNPNSNPNPSPTPSAKTGDPTNIYLPLGLLAASLFLILVIRHRKRKDCREHQ